MEKKKDFGLYQGVNKSKIRIEDLITPAWQPKEVADEKKEQESKRYDQQLMPKKKLISQEEILQREKAVADREAAVSLKEKIMAQTEENIGRKEKNMAQNAETIKEKVDLLSQKEKEISRKEKAVAQKEEDMSRKEEDLVRREEDIAEKIKDVAQREEAMSGKKEAMAQREEEISRKEKVMAQKEEEFEKRERLLEKKEKDCLEDIKLKKERCEKEETNLTIRKEAQEESEKILAEREAAVLEREKENREELKKIHKRQNELSNQERDLLTRENNAEAGFASQNQKALENLKKSQAEIQKEITALEQKKQQAEAYLNTEMEKIRDEKMAQVEKELEAYRNVTKAKIDVEINVLRDSAAQTIQDEKALIEAVKKALAKERKEVNEQKIKQDKEQRKIDDANADLDSREAIFREAMDEFEERVSAEVERRIQNTTFQLEQANKDLRSCKARLQEAQNQISVYKDRERAADGMSAEELLVKVEYLREENERLEKEIAQLPKDDQLEAYQTKAENYDRMVRKLHDTSIELEQLKRDREKYMQLEVYLADAKQEANYYKKRIELYQAMIEKYSEEVNRFRSLYEQPKELEGRLDAILAHEFNVLDYADEDDLSEIEWLERIYENCKASGVEFNMRLLKSFHTSLKTAGWSPLTVLAGVSGTGKSLLPEYYCRYGGIYFKPMAVQPDWDSPQSLFGFFNSVDNRFNATTLIRAMTQFVNYDKLRASIQKMLKDKDADAYLQKLAVEDYNLNDAMFLVLLDEMNLAHVELYFSDMLSKLERRRNTDENVDVEIDLGAGMDKFPLELSDNVLWVGTMNEDETTKSLSDKVLDRGNLISFPRPTEFISRTKAMSMPAAPMLRKAVWSKWIDSSVAENEQFKKNVQQYRECLQAVNEYMGKAGRALGHRVWQSIENYMANHPDVIRVFHDKKASDEEKEISMQRAFEEALVHKVMPKLRGIETDGDTRSKCIEPIKAVLFGTEDKKGMAPGLYEDFHNAINNTYETFLWNSAEYLEQE